MKWILLLLLLSFNLQAQEVVTCGLNTHEEIDACTIEDKLPTLVGRLFPTFQSKTNAAYNATDPCDPLTIDDEFTEDVVEVCPEWVSPKIDSYYYENQTYDVDHNPELSFYTRLTMENKPLESVFTSDLTAWATEQKSDLDFKLSLKNMDRFRRRMVKCGYSQPNMALLKLEILKNKDIVKRDCLTGHSPALDTEDATTALAKAVERDMAFSDSIKLSFIMKARGGGQNTAKNKRLIAKLRDLNDLLSLGDIDGAQEELASIVPNADFTQESKDILTVSIAAYLSQ